MGGPGSGGKRSGAGRKPTGRNGKATNMYLPFYVIAELDRLAAAEGVIRSAVVVRLVRQSQTKLADQPADSGDVGHGV